MKWFSYLHQSWFFYGKRFKNSSAYRYDPLLCLHIIGEGIGEMRVFIAKSWPENDKESKNASEKLYLNKSKPYGSE